MLDQTNKKLLTLCFVRNGDQILLGMKKRGVGEGKWNGFGGKVEPGEAITDAAIREVQEEVGITVSNIQQRGVINFTLPGEEKVWQVHVFLAAEFTGEIIETEEMRPQWFSIHEIPYEKMWVDDPYWLPMFLEGKKFEAEFTFETWDTVLKHDVREVDIL
jgi:mutator protein MutT